MTAKSEQDPGTFTPEDIGALRLLAIALGVVVCALLWVAPDAGLVVIGLASAMMGLSIAAIYGLRKLRMRKGSTPAAPRHRP